MSKIDSSFKKTTIWKVQYAPREAYLKKNLTPAELRRYNAMSISKKVQVIDNLQARGLFDKMR